MAKIKEFYRWNSEMSYPGQIIWKYEGRTYFWNNYEIIQAHHFKSTLSPYTISDMLSMDKPHHGRVRNYYVQLPQIKEFLKSLV